ncbi:AMP-dependent synthetase/ligase [Micromonospora lutea]|uniref:Acyl-CoA synthetase n=1 Tax=Micromonospora lutea TaxID=419825 RepID=A0ABQ4J3L3_9ACTN|nr:AMP-dependent synthetase/ligase [Micromonospora lutea]GIJ24762.1 long-chain acyl-CoA synthetase [Micromonospora lutea]
MRETAVEPIVGGDDGSLAEQVWRNAAEDPDAVQFIRPDPDPRSWPVRRSGRGGALPVTCRQFRDDVLALARGFVAAGVGHGDRVGLLSRTRYEWTLVDYALWSIGAVSVPVYDTSSVEQVRWMLGDSGAVCCVLETADHAASVTGVRAELPELRQIWRIDTGDLIELVARGNAVDAVEVDARRAAVTGDDIATIVYTSGTTGAPKGCVLTHRNLSADIGNATEVLPQLLHPGASTVLFLPLAHAFARMIQVGVVHTRTTMVHSADMSGVLDQLRRFRPTFVLAVPRMFEKMHDQARHSAEDARREWLFGLAERTAVRYSRALDTPHGPGRLLRLAHLVCEFAAYRRLRAALGGRCRMAFVGGAPMAERLGHFFRGAGITILEGYGLTEASPALTANLPTAMRIGTVGRPLPGVRLRIADDGEIHARGAMVFGGYWANPEATRETLTDDGWLRTGDLGRIDDDGFLRITGRTKEVMVTTAGKNLVPGPIEQRIQAHPLVSQVMLVADGRPYPAALVTVDPQAWTRWREQHGHSGASVSALREDPTLRGEIQTAIDRANRSVSRAEQVKTFRILPRDLTEADDELTPTLKIKREVVQEHFADEVEALYQGH